MDMKLVPLFITENWLTDNVSNKTIVSDMIKDHIGEDGTASCFACNKYTVLSPCGRHGTRDYQQV